MATRADGGGWWLRDTGFKKRVGEADLRTFMQVCPELALGARYGADAGDGWVELVTELRHDDLAAMVSATRVSVTSAFASLRQAGVLEGTRGRYRLHLAGLADAAEDPEPA